MQARLLIAILRERRFLATALISLLLYLALYLAAMNYLIAEARATEPFLGLDIQPNWRELVLRSRSSFLFEPIGTARLGPVVLFLSIPNIVIGFLLGALIGANVAVSYYGFRSLGMRGVRGLHALMGTIPALVSGAACCVPTLVLVIGIQLTATLAAMWSMLVPLSALLLVASLAWSLYRIDVERTCQVRAQPVGA